MSDRKRPLPYDGDDHGHTYRPHKKQHHDQDQNRYPNVTYHDYKKRSLIREEYRQEVDGPEASSFARYMPLPATLPPLPTISAEYSLVPFTHRSVTSESRSVVGTKSLSYDRLEFLGDAYLELFASRLIFNRFSHLPTGQMSQLRELFVRNETLAEYSCAYGFDQRVRVADAQSLQADSRKANKGYSKILADVFEAYVSAIVLSHGDQGFGIAEKWLHALWEPKLRDAVVQDRNLNPDIARSEDGTGDPRKKYNPDAKAILQKRIIGGSGKKLAYETYRDTVELKGAQLGQNRHFIALYLTGYGYERKLLGKGEGKNKVEAGNWAAIEAMHGDSKRIVDECERIAKAEKEKRLVGKKAADPAHHNVGHDRDVKTVE